MGQERLIRWLAYGLNASLTGIERVIVLQALELVNVLPEDCRLEVLVDGGASWVEELPRDSRVEVVFMPRPRMGVAGKPGQRLPAAQVTHSFGPRLSRGGRSGYSIWDWGPLRDRAMPVKARTAWSVAMLSARRAGYVHCLAASVVETAPLAFRGLPWLVSPPPSPRGSHAPIAERQAVRPLLFVGSVSTHKRLDLLTAAAALGSLPPVVMVGDGTEALTGPGVTGLGRVPEAKLDMLYETCLAVILMSDYEGLGLPVEEAARRGRRSIVSRAVARQQAADLQPYLVVAEQTPGAVVDAARRMASLPTVSRLTREPGLNLLTRQLLRGLS